MSSSHGHSSKQQRSTPSRPSNGKGSPGFIGLPHETQQQIVGNLARNDLLLFQRVSLHCLSLASAELYRDLNLTITNFHDEENGHPSLHAADTLQTILASEHDYGLYIKNFRVGMVEDTADPLLGASSIASRSSEPLSMARILWDAKSDSSRFLNTALLLVIRKATILETFEWDAPIELSGAVYQALHRITSLKHLRIRLDIWLLPKMVIRQSHHSTAGLAPVPGIPPAQYIAAPTAAGDTGLSSTHTPLAAPKKAVKRKKAGHGGGCDYWANPRVFSGFKHLSTLALMGMSNLECLHEIAKCIKASSATLKSLKISLSTELARKARKPVAANPELDDLSETDLEEDELMDDPLLPPGNSTQPAPPANEADIRREKLAQESILVKIFDLQSVAAEGRKIEKHISASDPSYPSPEYGPSYDAIDANFKTLLRKMMQFPDPSDNGPTSQAKRLEHFTLIRKIADLFITGHSRTKTKSSNQLNPSITSPKELSGKSKASSAMPSDHHASGSSSASHLPSNWNELLDMSLPLSHSTLPLEDKLMPQLLNKIAGSSASGPTLHTFPVSEGKSGKSKAYVTPSQEALCKQIQQQVNQKWQLAQAQAQQGLAQNPHALPHVVGSQTTPAMFPPAMGHDYGPYKFDQSDTRALAAAITAEQFWGPASNQDPTAFSQPFDFMETDTMKDYCAKKAQAAKNQEGSKVLPAKHGKTADSDEQADVSAKTNQGETQSFFAGETVSEPSGDTIDVDMEHPDTDTQDLGDDQETDSAQEEEKTATPRKRARIAEKTSRTLAKMTPLESAENSLAEAESVNDAVQAYIRTTHGLQLESLALEWVPLKASIVARALDLSVLRHVTLLDVGPQDAFWALLIRLQIPIANIALKTIHTDSASFSLLKFLTTFDGLEELFIHERGTKQDVPDTAISPKTPDIRGLALKKHITTLKRLMIRNDRNDSWDMDTKTLQFLAYKGNRLKELAVSLSMKTYHVLMQYFAAFGNLYALHLINLRSGDRNHMLLHSESLNFAIDSLSHCPDMDLKYIAIANTVVALEPKPQQSSKSSHLAIKGRKDKKGKGKAPANELSSWVAQLEDPNSSDDAEEALASVLAGESKTRFSTRFSAVDDVKIFTKQIRMGKL